MNVWKSVDRRARAAGLVAAGAVAVAVAWYLGSPLFINRSVDEAFPAAAAIATPAIAMTDTGAAEVVATPAEAMAEMPAAAGMAEVQSAAADAHSAGSAMKEPEAAAATATMPEQGSQAMGDAAVALATGSFTVVDTIHKGEGSARIYALPDGMRVLRLEDFKVTNGPDLFVYLSGHTQPRSAAELHGQGELELGRLKGNVGNQNYELPAGVDLSQFRSVVIYCKQFSVIFSTAELGQISAPAR